MEWRSRLRSMVSNFRQELAGPPFDVLKPNQRAWEAGFRVEGLTDSGLAELLKPRLEVASLADVRARIGEAPFIVVINRSILTLDTSQDELLIKNPPGGAAGAMYDALRSAGGGVVLTTATTELEMKVAQTGALVSPGQNIWIHYLHVPAETFDLFYNQFANPALWLIQHGMGDSILPRPQPRDWLRNPRAWIGHYLPWVHLDAIHKIIFTAAVDRAYREGYQRVNRQYAEALMGAYGSLPGARIMIQDYHFYLLPQYLREMGSKALLDHFIHIPWMSSQDLQRVMPETLWRELLTSLLQNDIVGFHTSSYCHDFLTAARSLLGADVDFANGLVTYQGRHSLVQSYPISVDVGRLRRTALAGEEGVATLRHVQGLRRKVARKLLIVRADRADLSKGILEGLRALDRMLARAPSVRGQVQMLALLQSSRLDVPEYRNLFERVKSLARELNARWTPDAAWDGLIEDQAHRMAYLLDLEEPAARAWPLVVVDFTDKPYTEVVGAQIAADIALVNPLADGMNLVAKEVAVNNKPSFIRDFNQRLRQAGSGATGVIPAVIVGSTRMGAYAELKEGLLPVDPRSIPETADALLHAVRMQSAARGLLGSRQLVDHLPAQLRRVFQRPTLPDELADRAAEQVSRNTIQDWMDKILLDVELLRDPHWRRALQLHGIRRARGAIERGQTLADAFPRVDSTGNRISDGGRQ